MLARVETALLTGLALRCLWVALVPMVLMSDPAAYDAMARNLLNHGVYGFEPDVPNATWPPGTSALYALIYALPGPDILATKTVNVLLSTLNIWLAWGVARRLFGARAALFTAWAMALWPQMIFFTTLTASETPFLTAVLAGTLFWDRARDGHLANAVFAGIFIALACYFRSIALLLPIAFAIGELLKGKDLLRLMVRLVITGVIMATCIAPWSLRNTQLYGTTVVLSSNFGSNLYIGNGPGSTGRFGSTDTPDELESLDYVERSQRLGDLAKAEIRANPGAFVKRSLSKLVIIHDRETVGVAWNQMALRPLIGTTGEAVLKGLATLYWWVILGAALIGLIWQIIRGIGLTILWSIPMAAWGYFASIHAIILAGDRFHMPQAPFVAMLGASALAGWLARRDQLRS
ncbi:glycosyltransferase family 39 protein [Rhodobacteraceae bacterium]|nr:glycosyltransferase family 39 protein [Paracoccaceae bacterium]